MFEIIYSLLQKNSVLFVIYLTYFSAKYMVYSTPLSDSVSNPVKLTIDKLKINSKVNMLNISQSWLFKLSCKILPKRKVKHTVRFITTLRFAIHNIYSSTCCSQTTEEEPISRSFYIRQVSYCQTKSCESECVRKWAVNLRVIHTLLQTLI